MKDDKFFLMQDEDVKITYERRKTPKDETIHGFNPMVIFALIVIAFFCAVTIGKDNQPTQQSPIIINNK